MPRKLLLSTLALCLSATLAHAQTTQTPAMLAAAEALPAAEGSLTGAFASANADLGMAVMHVVAGHSLVLHTTRPMKRIYIGNPDLLTSYNSSPTEVVLTAKAPGTSTVVLWDQADQSHLYSIASEPDCVSLRMALQSAFPEADFAIESHEGRLYLTGTVPTDAMFDAMGKTAIGYSKDIVNGLRVVAQHGKQVQLKLRIVEVDRAKAVQFGVNLFGPFGSNVGSSTTGQFPSTATYTPAGSSTTSSTGTTTATSAMVTVTDPLSFFFYNFKNNIGATVKDLENKSILQILAEPTLTTISGLPARFLSGGEFPVPVVQGGVGSTNAVTIVFRPYGVKVDFTPLVNRDGTIHLKVAPEVSALDYANAVTVSGTTVPALSTRRAETEVEIKDGQSFVLSGLLDRRTTDNFSKTPGIASVPILGQLFKSKNLNHSTLELMVIVTATVVDPLGEMPPTSEPAMVVPNMDADEFDRKVRGKVGKDIKKAANDGTVPSKTPFTPLSEPRPDNKPEVLNIAAFSREEEGASLLRSLRRRGYYALVERNPKDNLFHVQMGPFKTHAEAISLRAELVDAGYDATLQ